MKKVTDKMMLEFVGHLKEFHTGASKLVCASGLCGWGTPNHIRRVVHHARMNGYPICSDVRGYYYSENVDDIVATIKNLKTKIYGLTEVVASLERSATSASFVKNIEKRLEDVN